MAILFYDYLINWPKLTKGLELLELDSEDRLEITAHVEHILHTEILMVVISHLPAGKHDQFIQLFYAAPFDENHWQFLRTHGDGNIELAIQQKSNQIIEEILSEL